LLLFIRHFAYHLGTGCILIYKYQSINSFIIMKIAKQYETFWFTLLASFIHEYSTQSQMFIYIDYYKKFHRWKYIFIIFLITYTYYMSYKIQEKKKKLIYHYSNYKNFNYKKFWNFGIIIHILLNINYWICNKNYILIFIYYTTNI
jgi:hypothetical protein